LGTYRQKKKPLFQCTNEKEIVQSHLSDTANTLLNQELKMIKKENSWDTEVIKIISKCIKQDPDNRPNFKTVTFFWNKIRPTLFGEYL